MSGVGGTGPWRLCTPDRYRLAEGARWSGDRLHFVDLPHGVLYRCGRPPEPAPRTPGAPGAPGAPAQASPPVPPAAPPAVLLDVSMPLGAVAPARFGGRAWVLATGPGIALADGRGRLDWLDRPEDRPGRTMRMNDGVCDPSGRFWAGSMDVGAAPGAGSLYRADPDGRVHRVLDGLTVPNGPAFTADGAVMYLADSARGTVTRYDVDPATGRLGRAEPFTRLAPGEGRPDGMTVDDEGNLWVALWGAGRVRCHAPDGRVVGTVTVPTPQVSSVVFGGGRMSVTTARHGLARPDPLAGAVLARPSPVTAPPARPYGPRPTP
ncbi:SMP-30/gluconolactonase/LRE family protein [Streptomyces sp. NPDC058417]|uniref:SMP-30/gluconolactonase/LRE family protein n=1 Tax=unclassified Streptomyces TaxID=2593676 RepID=UPI00365CB07E